MTDGKAVGTYLEHKFQALIHLRRRQFGERNRLSWSQCRPESYEHQAAPRIKREAPRTWDYLQSHADRLDARASSIYRNRPRFSVFGVGPYSFAPWKVAISGFYKRLDFRCVGPVEDKPVVLDDTCYFLPCRTEHDARLLAELLNYSQALTSGY